MSEALEHTNALDRVVEYQDHSFNSTLSDDFFESSFSFLSPGATGMDQYIASPLSVHSQEAEQKPILEQNDNREQSAGLMASEAHTRQANLTLSPLNMVDSHFDYGPNNVDHSHQEINIQPYPYHMPCSMSYDSINSLQMTTGPLHPHHPVLFHPYRASGDFPRSPRTHRSPALSASPGGSSGSHRLSYGAATSASSSLISPHSVIESQLSDGSPPPLMPYPLPLTYGTPYIHGSHTPDMLPSGPGLSMVAGFPCPVRPIRQSPSMTGKARGGSRLRAMRPNTRKIKQEEEASDIDDDVDDVAQGELDHLPNSDKTDRHGSAKTEGIRQARIQSEQRRRDELREGFSKLKSALPSSNQRSSKVSLLDRAVSHIDAIESANRYLIHQKEEAVRECAKLREILHNEVMRQRANSGSPASNTKRMQ
ncbi:hypothetical protein IAU60_003334 [Kwoniella sp. DSM 27419]